MLPAPVLAEDLRSAFRNWSRKHPLPADGMDKVRYIAKNDWCCVSRGLMVHGSFAVRAECITKHAGWTAPVAFGGSWPLASWISLAGAFNVQFHEEI